MSACNGCLGNLPCTIPDCPSQRRDYQHLEGAWRVKDKGKDGKGVKFEGKDGWVKLQCKGACGLWAYRHDADQVFRLSGIPARTPPYHGPDCGTSSKKKKKEKKKKSKKEKRGKKRKREEMDETQEEEPSLSSVDGQLNDSQPSLSSSTTLTQPPTQKLKLYSKHDVLTHYKKHGSLANCTYNPRVGMELVQAVLDLTRRVEELESQLKQQEEEMKKINTVASVDDIMRDVMKEMSGNNSSNNNYDVEISDTPVNTPPSC